MRRFLLVLLIPTLLVAGANWRTVLAIWQRPFLKEVAVAEATGEKANQSISEQDRLIIPRLRLEAPITASTTDPTQQADWQTIKQDLRQGVSLSTKLTLPGETGTAVIIGHSSDWWPHRYAAIFANLDQLEPNDSLVVDFREARYHYRVIGKQVVSPYDQQFFNDLVTSSTDQSRLALITCTPLFTTAKRLVVTAELVP